MIGQLLMKHGENTTQTVSGHSGGPKRAHHHEQFNYHRWVPAEADKYVPANGEEVQRITHIDIIQMEYKFHQNLSVDKVSDQNKQSLH